MVRISLTIQKKENTIMTMNISVSRTVRENVTLPQEQVNNITIESICRAFDLPRDVWLENGYVMYEEDYGHGRPFDKKMREATEEDKAAIAVISAIRKLR